MAAATAASSAAHDARRDHTFDTIAGHALPRRLAETMLALDRVPHALLFVGPAGIGKVSFAWALAKELLWNGLHGERTGEEGERRRLRLASRVARENTHPDVFTIEKSGALRQIQIDTMRAFEDAHAWVGPVEGRIKVCLIEDAHAMNVAAANCFLKLLEEPPPHLKFLLTTDAPNEMLATIRSRCAQIPFHPLAEEETRAWLERRAPGRPPEALDRAARLAEGRPGRALELLEGSDDTAAVLDQLRRLDREGFSRLFATAAAIATRHDGRAVAATLHDLVAFYREALLHALDEGSGVVAERGVGAADRSGGHDGGGDTAPDAHGDLDPLLLFPEQREAFAALGRHGPAAVMAALEILVAEILHQRTMFHRELHLEGVLSRVGIAVRPHRATAAPATR